MPPWSDDVEHVLREQVLRDERGFTQDDLDTLEDADFSEEQLQELFEEGFLSRSGSDVSSDERFNARDAFFDWMEYLGYDRGDFDWHGWREYMGYE